MALEGDLQALDCGDIDVSDTGRKLFSRDASIFEIIPEVVVAPRSTEDIGKLVRYATTHSGVHLTPRSGGSDMSGAALGSSIVIDFTRHMNKVTDIVRDEHILGQGGYASVQPGMYYRDFERATLARGLQYPVYPASRDLCALGGMIGNNAAGERSLKYGQTVDWIHSVTAVLADGNEYFLGSLSYEEVQAKMNLEGFEGNLYRSMWKLVTENTEVIERARPKVPKNSSGYYLWRVWDGKTFNLARLFVGSQGTLGIMTQANLGLMRPAPHRRMVVVFLKDMRRVTEVVHALLPFEPEALESFDNKTLSFTLRFLPDFVRIMGASNIVSLALRFLPEAWMVLVSGAPQLILMAEFAGESESHLELQAKEALGAMQKMGLRARITATAEETHKYWTIRRQSFNVLRNHTKGNKKTVPFIDDIIISIERMPVFLPKLYAILEPYGLTLTINGHAGSGNFHIIPLMDLSQEKNRQLIPEISAKVYDLVLDYRGSITAEHNDGLIRGPWVQRQFGSKMYDLFRQTKKIWDPQGIFNPGKKIDVDWNDALRHIRKD
jgi:FAD/FMN-containing dehydrogenase